MSKKRGRDNRFRGDRSPNATPYMQRALAEFTAGVQTVHQDLKPSKITLVSHDTVCHELGEFLPGDEIDFKIKGGGGTDFCCVFEWIESSGVQPKCLVMLTDLEGRFPKFPPDYPVLWVSTTKKIAPFGETARMEV